MANLFKNKVFQGLLLAIFIVVFWYPIIFNNELFYDDLSFVDAFKSGNPGLQYFFKPHNEHFMPIFKGLFFVVYSLFGTNIIPFMVISIIFHIINTLLVFLFLQRLFKGRDFLPFLLSVFFSLNVVYFEILHWFVNVGQAIMFSFLLITLIFMQKYFERNDKKDYWLSVFFSFFIPMNFSLGFLGIIFIKMYYFFIEKKSLSMKTISNGIRFLSPYFIAWLLSLSLYLYFTFSNLFLDGKTSSRFTFDLLKVFFYFVLGLVGLFVRFLGYSTLVFPYTTAFAAIFTLLLFFLSMFFFFYFLLKNKKSRLPLFWGSGEILFSIFGIFLCYGVLAFLRSSLEPMSFIGWGRYHYLTAFFATILLGAMLPRIINILSIVFDRKRVKIFLALIFISMLLTHFILVRQKSYSPIRSEGAVPTIDCAV